MAAAKSGAAKPAAAEKRDDGQTSDIPLGIGAVLPAEDLQGTLIPIVALTFDEAPGDVSEALAAPTSLTVKWPIKGKVTNLHDLTGPARLSWQVFSSEEKTVLRSTAALGETTIKVAPQHEPVDAHPGVGGTLHRREAELERVPRPRGRSGRGPMDGGRADRWLQRARASCARGAGPG